MFMFTPPQTYVIYQRAILHAKAISLAFVVLFFVQPLTGFANQTTNTVPTDPRPVITVGLPAYDLVPYSYQRQTKSGEIITEGLLITMLELIAIQAEFRFEIRLYPTYSDVVTAFKANDLDMLIGVSATFDRQQYMAFSEPMFSIRRAVITQQKTVNSLQDLTGDILAIEKGFALNELIPNLLPQSLIRTENSSQDALDAVNTGRSDGYIGDALALSTMLRDQVHNDLTLSLLPDLPPDHLHLAVHKGKHKLLSRINFALEDIKANALQAIYNQWFSPYQRTMMVDYGQIGLTQDEKNWLAKNPKISIGVHRQWAPFDFMNERKQHDGLSADVLSLLSNMLGVKFISSALPVFSSTQQAFTDGELMMLSAVTPTNETVRVMDFSLPYTNEPWVVLSRSEQLTNFMPNGTERVAIIVGSGGEALLPTLCLSCVPIPFINHVSAFQALQKSEVDNALASLHFASPLLHNNYVGQFKINGKISEQNHVPLSFAINFRHPMLLSIINKAIHAIPTSELSRLEQKWLTYEYQEGLSPRAVAKWAGLLTLIITVVITCIILWNRKMAAEIQQRKQAELRAKAAELHLHTLADNIDGVVLQHVQTFADRPLHFHYSFISAGVQEMFGFDVATVEANPHCLFEQIIALDYDELESSMLLALQAGHWESEQQIKGNDCDSKWVQFKSQITVRDEHSYDWNTVITDISLLKQQQLALENARHKAEIATAAKSQFLATISHEVRTPISGILGLLELMQEHTLNDELQSLHGGLHQSARNLLHIVNDVLDYSKIEAGKLDINPTDIELGKVLARIVQPQSIHAQQKGLAFHYWQDPLLAQWLFTDDIRIHQILNNFLNNAIKFTEHGTISLSVDVLKEKTANQPLCQKVKLTVTDTGIGIAKGKQHALFQPFEQADSTTSRRFGGTGLGLAIARKLIEQMHGSLQLQSEEGKGSAFSVTFDIPRSQQQPETPKALALPPTATQQARKNNPKHTKQCLILGYFIQQEELCHYLKHLGLTPKVIQANHLDLLQLHITSVHPSHVVIAMSLWQQLSITDAWIQQLPVTTNIIVINQNPMLSPEPLGMSWCLSVNPLLPDNLIHVLTKPVSHEPIVSLSKNHSIKNKYKESREQAEQSGRLILVAEDHPINQQVIKKQLERIGVQADIVENGVLAFEALKKHRYGLLLTDCHMPEMDGYTLSATIRSQESRCAELFSVETPTTATARTQSTSAEETSDCLTEMGRSFTAQYDVLDESDHASEKQSRQINAWQLPIVALTANAVQGEDAHCFEYGMNDFLVKPVSIEQLRMTIEKWLPERVTATETTKEKYNSQQGDQRQAQIKTSIDVNAEASHQALTDDFSDLFGAIDNSFNQQNHHGQQSSQGSADKEENWIQADTLNSFSQRNQTTAISTTLINQALLLELFGDQATVNGLIAEFIENHCKDITQLNDALNQHQYQQASQIAHRMKGAAKMIACDDIAKPLANIEALTQEKFDHHITQQDFATNQDEIADLDEDIEHCMAQLEKQTALLLAM
ncbi:transporter substrate-binding domain-containing protein [Photobacterium sanguinicancri]|uniref:histidine kinase n=1 Tax=Photobacterium sanguinicancri TaxID=875932 RepID=A0AAW7Y4A5_9GAMM|nr:transporter substrate-binding domain-containing protein [Photobacterium sanguinicancri]MDO6542606.1 transporter substrate-binding domain-containing protein [Photobacterium sanguinicancri]